MEPRTVEIIGTAVVSASLLLAEHYWPWQAAFQKKLHPTINYVLGTLALIVPQTVLFGLWGLWSVVWAIWITTIAGGAVVVVSYWLDGWIVTRTKLTIAQRENTTLRGVNDGAGIEDS